MDSRPPQQPAPAEKNGSQAPMAGAQVATASAARERVELPMPTSSPQVQLLEQGNTILPSPKSASSSDTAHRKAGQLTAMPQEAQPEKQLPHSSVDTVSPARSAHDDTELSDLMTAPQQQEEVPEHSKEDTADTTRGAEKPQQLEPHHSDTESTHLSGAVEKQEGVQAHPIDRSASLARSESASSGSSFYSPRNSEPGSDDSNGKAKKSFTLELHGAASHPESDQDEMLQGQDAPGKAADPAATCAGNTLQSPAFGIAASHPAGGKAAPENAGTFNAAAGSVMH